MPKHIFVTGGVASSLGKGLTASSLGSLLKMRGLRVTMQKLDPYINVDPGTMNPFEHGEVFVTDDGGETDLDLGHYERFIDEPLTATPTPPPARSTRRCSPPSVVATTWARRCRSSRTSPTRSSGGSRAWPPTTSTWSSPRSVARSATSRSSRSSRRSGSSALDVGRDNVCYVHVTLVPFIGPSGEQKTKPTQHSVTELRSRGIQPDVIVCRSEAPI
jgi:CTP synthase